MNGRIGGLLGMAVLMMAAAAEEEPYVATPLTRPGEFTSGIEGPCCDRDGHVYAVNFARQQTIGRVSPDGRGEVFVTLPGRSVGNGIVFDSRGRMHVADYVGHNILRIDPGTGAIEVFAHAAMSQPNDLAIAPDDTLYASDPDWAHGKGQVWKVATSGAVERVAADLGTTNGIEVSPDGRWLYVNESVQRHVWKFPILPDGTLGEKQLIRTFPDHGFDGMRCDAEGNLYITRHGKGTVVIMTPEGRSPAGGRRPGPVPDQPLLRRPRRQDGLRHRGRAHAARDVPRRDPGTGLAAAPGAGTGNDASQPCVRRGLPRTLDGETNMTPQQKAESLGIAFSKQEPGYLALVVRTGHLLITSGHVSDLKGKLGAGLSVEQGKAAARDCAAKILNSVWNAHGTLDGLRVLKLLGCVNSTPDFVEQHLVMNGCSDLLHEVFGKADAGAHARSAPRLRPAPDRGGRRGRSYLRDPGLNRAGRTQGDAPRPTDVRGPRAESRRTPGREHRPRYAGTWASGHAGIEAREATLRRSANVSRRTALRTLSTGAGVLALGSPKARSGSDDAPAPKRVAAVVTVYRPFSHADVLVSRLLRGWKNDGGPGPRLSLASLYIDQPEPDDLGHRLAAEHSVPIFDTIEGAITVGTDGIPLEGVLSIGEHGSYPTNAEGQHLYPRRRFFEQIVACFRRHGKVVPVFNDKHLGPRWEDARWMYETAKGLGIPLMAGSSLPLTYRDPDLTLRPGTPIEAALAVGYSEPEIYGIHALEAYQALVETRRGAESGVRWVQCLQGDALRAEIDAAGLPPRLLHGTLHAAGAPGWDELKGRLTDLTVLYRFQYRDGFAGRVLMLDGLAQATAAGVMLARRAGPRITRFEERTTPHYPHFAFLLHAIERMVRSGRPSYPVERTLLTSGLLDRLLSSRHEGARRLETPELGIAYTPVDYPHAPDPPLPI